MLKNLEHYVQVLKIEKKFPELNNVYEDMIKSKKTETLGYRGLMEQNLRNQDYHHAFLYGEKLFSINPNIEKLYDTLIFIAAKTKNWNQIVLLSDKAFSHKIISKNDLNENKSIGFYEIAKIKYDSDIKDSLKNILKEVSLPIVADIHFHYKRAIEAAEMGASCLRINPGNIGDIKKVKDLSSASVFVILILFFILLLISFFY